MKVKYDISTNIVKGLTNMNIHPDFKTKKILNFIADLIIEYDYKSFYDLSDGDKSEFAAHLIEAAGKDGEWEFATEHAFSDLLILHFRGYLQLSNDENKEKFLDCAKWHAIEYYEDTMEALFNYVYSDYQQSKDQWLNHNAKWGDPNAAYDLYRENLS